MKKGMICADNLTPVVNPGCALLWRVSGQTTPHPPYAPTGYRHAADMDWPHHEKSVLLRIERLDVIYMQAEPRGPQEHATQN